MRVLLDRAAALIGLVICSPLLALAAAAIWLEDGFPIFFRQTRIGCRGAKFQLVKLRSMRVTQGGAAITASGDSRLTKTGQILRKYKIDELPQLWNVLKGEMSLVGPRPEVPCYVNLEDPLWRIVLGVRPGLTGLASLVYRNEEEILARAGDAERFYREEILPRKLALSVQQIQSSGFWSDVRLILLTIRYSFLPAGFDSERIQRQFSAKDIR